MGNLRGLRLGKTTVLGLLWAAGLGHCGCWGAGVAGGGEKGQNKRKGNVVCCSLFPSSLVKHFFLVKKSNKNQPAEDPVVKTHTKTSSLSKVKGKMLR